MEWSLRDAEEHPTYSLHVGGILLEVYPHGGATDSGITDYQADQPHWQAGVWSLKEGLQPYESPLEPIQECRTEAGTLAEKQAEVLELAKAWLRDQVAAFDALATETKAKPEADDPFCPGCERSWSNCACVF